MATNYVMGGWAAPPARVASRFYSTVFGTIASSVAVPAIDTLYLYPFWLPRRCAIVELFVEVAATGAGSSCKAGIWAMYLPTLRPSGAPLIADNTGVTTSTGSGRSLSAINGPITLEAGWYWAGSKFTGTLPTMVGIPAGTQISAWTVGQGGRALSWNSVSMAATYSSNLPTIATNQSFTVVNSSAVPIVGYGT